jgi:hypothetical protein
MLQSIRQRTFHTIEAAEKPRPPTSQELSRVKLHGDALREVRVPSGVRDGHDLADKVTFGGDVWGFLRVGGTETCYLFSQEDTGESSLADRDDAPFFAESRGVPLVRLYFSCFSGATQLGVGLARTATKHHVHIRR